MAYTSREAFFAFRRSPLLTALSIATIAFALYTLSVFGLVWTNIDRVLEGVEERVEVIAYLVDGTDPTETSALMREVAAYPEVDSIAYLSKEDALERARAELTDYAELYEDLEANPLPASVEIALRDGFRDASDVGDVATRVARFPFVEEIKYGEDWVQKLDFLQDLSLFLGLVMGGVFAAIAFVAIGATINIVLISREDEIAIMKMVGATRAFIARPLVIEGFAKGVIGAVVALVLLTLTYSLLEQRVVSLTFYSPLQVAGGVLLGGALGAVASIVTLRRHLSSW
ncbi:MAG TPA: permease-like cell division protein FtsX [Gemmatimonadota bacterium]|nr:permease-like cell division protein FtsX [Gemmatimonadota bacterium]